MLPKYANNRVYSLHKCTHKRHFRFHDFQKNCFVDGILSSTCLRQRTILTLDIKYNGIQPAVVYAVHVEVWNKFTFFSSCYVFIAAKIEILLFQHCLYCYFETVLEIGLLKCLPMSLAFSLWSYPVEF